MFLASAIHLLASVLWLIPTAIVPLCAATPLTPPTPAAHLPHRTSDLERGYWPSYNVPAFSEVYNGMGYDALRSHFASKAQQGLSGFDKLDADMSYQLAPRAQLFRRDAGERGHWRVYGHLPPICMVSCVRACGHML